MQRQRNYEQDLQEARNYGFWVLGGRRSPIRAFGLWVRFGVSGVGS